MNAREVESFERCPQRFLFEKEWESFVKIPTDMLRSAIRADLIGEQDAKTAFLSESARYQLPPNYLDPYATIQHYAALAEVIALHLRMVVGELGVVEDAGEWQTNALQDKNGNLHHILLVDKWNEDKARAESHSWRLLGDLIHYSNPIFQTIYILGQSRDGRRYGNWGRGFRHPNTRELRFAVKSGGDGKWELTWRERMEMSAEAWLKQMSKDNVFSASVIRQKVNIARDDLRVKAAERDLARIEDEMKKATATKNRSACDLPVCPFQSVCWDKQQRGIEEIGLFRRVRYVSGSDGVDISQLQHIREML